MNSRKILIGTIAVVAVVVMITIGVIFIPRLVNSGGSSEDYWPTDGWQTSTPEEQGFDSVKLAEGLQGLKDKKILIHSLLIIRNGHMILDAYFYPYDPSIPHKLASVTKSFTTTLIGIAISQGKINLDEPVLSYFPGRTIANLDSWKKSITIRNLVSNLNGYESGCLMGDEPTLDAMRATPDWVQFALDRKVVWEPGTNFCYDSPGMHILSAIIQQATGMTELEYAQQNLFTPLGITEVHWEADPQGYSHGWGDLFLKPPDAAKLGFLFLNQGNWNGKQIVPSEWVQDSTKAISKTPSDSYGYGWWVSDDSYYAFGRGGQTIKVYPQYNAIVVITADTVDYDQISPVIEAAFLDPDQALPPNFTGVALLKSTLAALAQPLHPRQSGPLPDTAKAISGKTYTFGPNILDLASIRFQFKGNQEANVYMNLEGQDVIWPVGLDGNYRLEPNGLALRGYWSDQQTFELEVFESSLNVYIMHFEEDKVVLETSVMKIEGTEQNP